MVDGGWTPEYLIDASERFLHNARRYLETEEAINWVSDEISSALYWAMKGWLLSHGHEPEFAYTSQSMRRAFTEVAPEDLKGKAISCLNSAGSLDFFLFGDGTDPDWQPLPMVEWKKKAYECLTEAEGIINTFKTEMLNSRKAR